MSNNEKETNLSPKEILELFIKKQKWEKRPKRPLSDRIKSKRKVVNKWL